MFYLSFLKKKQGEVDIKLVTKNNEKVVYICSVCGQQSNKWSGKCTDCGNWNSMYEDIIIEKISKSNIKKSHPKNSINIENQKLSNIDITSEKRLKTGFLEFDRVLGGGIVKGSVILLSGSPGIGKSTLLLQICQHICNFKSVFYFSGEESEKQIKLRANRLAVLNENTYIISNNDLESIVNIIECNKPGLVIIDSIQTIKNAQLSSSVGSIVQVRESTNLLMDIAKSWNIPIIIVGHVNKDGGIAGPKILEHIVDTVLQFESEKYNQYKILRTNKNRFGSTNEIGIFQMESEGLIEVANPSVALLSSRDENLSGITTSCVMEGSRPIFVEIQALVTKSDFAVPRRTAIGFDYNRLCLILAILEKKCGYTFGKLDVYINVAGGIRINDPSADLAAAVAIISSLSDTCITPNTVIIGEIGLIGEIRAVPSIIHRIQECIKLRFNRCIIPKNFSKLNKDNSEISLFNSKIEILELRYIWEFFKYQKK